VTFVPLQETIPADLYALWCGDEQPPMVQQFISTLAASE